MPPWRCRRAPPVPEPEQDDVAKWTGILASAWDQNRPQYRRRRPTPFHEGLLRALSSLVSQCPHQDFRCGCHPNFRNKPINPFAAARQISHLAYNVCSAIANISGPPPCWFAVDTASQTSERQLQFSKTYNDKEIHNVYETPINKFEEGEDELSDYESLTVFTEVLHERSLTYLRDEDLVEEVTITTEQYVVTIKDQGTQKSLPEVESRALQIRNEDTELINQSSQSCNSCCGLGNQTRVVVSVPCCKCLVTINELESEIQGGVCPLCKTPTEIKSKNEIIPSEPPEPAKDTPQIVVEPLKPIEEIISKPSSKQIRPKYLPDLEEEPVEEFSTIETDMEDSELLRYGVTEQTEKSTVNEFLPGAHSSMIDRPPSRLEIKELTEVPREPRPVVQIEPVETSTLSENFSENLPTVIVNKDYRKVFEENLEDLGEYKADDELPTMFFKKNYENIPEEDLEDLDEDKIEDELPTVVFNKHYKKIFDDEEEIKIEEPRLVITEPTYPKPTTSQDKLPAVETPVDTKPVIKKEPSETSNQLIRLKIKESILLKPPTNENSKFRSAENSIKSKQTVTMESTLSKPSTIKYKTKILSETPVDSKPVIKKESVEATKAPRVVKTEPALSELKDTIKEEKKTPKQTVKSTETSQKCSNGSKCDCQNQPASAQSPNKSQRTNISKKSFEPTRRPSILKNSTLSVSSKTSKKSTKSKNLGSPVGSIKQSVSSIDKSKPSTSGSVKSKKPGTLGSPSISKKQSISSIDKSKPSTSKKPSEKPRPSSSQYPDSFKSFDSRRRNSSEYPKPKRTIRSIKSSRTKTKLSNEPPSYEPSEYYETSIENTPRTGVSSKGASENDETVSLSSQESSVQKFVRQSKIVANDEGRRLEEILRESHIDQHLQVLRMLSRHLLEVEIPLLRSFLPFIQIPQICDHCGHCRYAQKRFATDPSSQTSRREIQSLPLVVNDDGRICGCRASRPSPPSSSCPCGSPAPKIKTGHSSGNSSRCYCSSPPSPTNVGKCPGHRF